MKAWARSFFGAVKNSSTEVFSNTLPLYKNKILSAKRLACPRSCVDMTMVVPVFLIELIISSTTCVAAGSRLAVGSSKNRTSGFKDQARPIANRCCSPVDKDLAGILERRERPVFFIISSIIGSRLTFGTPRHFKPK